jgi:hypothetical protein
MDEIISIENIFIMPSTVLFPLYSLINFIIDVTISFLRFKIMPSICTVFVCKKLQQIRYHIRNGFREFVGGCLATLSI